MKLFSGMSVGWEEVLLWLRNILLITSKGKEKKMEYLLYLAPKSLLIQNPIYCNLTSVFSKFLTSGPLYSLKKFLTPKVYLVIPIDIYQIRN